jgi:hypothetical protein
MTCDIVALLSERPDARVVHEAIVAAMEQPADVREAMGGLRVHDQDGRLVVSIEQPLLVPVAGEAVRLLGPEMAQVPTPFWWVDLRSAADVPGALALTRRVAEGLARRVGGLVWPVTAPGGAFAGPADGGRS